MEVLTSNIRCGQHDRTRQLQAGRAFQHTQAGSLSSAEVGRVILRAQRVVLVVDEWARVPVLAYGGVEEQAVARVGRQATTLSSPSPVSSSSSSPLCACGRPQRRVRTLVALTLSFTLSVSVVAPVSITVIPVTSAIPKHTNTQTRMSSAKRHCGKHMERRRRHGNN